MPGRTRQRVQLPSQRRKEDFDGERSSSQYCRSVHAIGHRADGNVPNDQQRPATCPQMRPAHIDTRRRLVPHPGVIATNQREVKAKFQTGGRVMYLSAKERAAVHARLAAEDRIFEYLADKKWSPETSITI